MASIGSVFEDFNLDDLSSDDEHGFDFPPLDENDVELHDEHVEVDDETNLDPFLFVSSTFYSFKSEVKEYLIQCLKHLEDVKADPNTILSLDANFLRREEGTPLELFHQGVLRKWRSYEQNFRIRRINNVDHLLNDTHKIQHLVVPYVEEWPSIVRNAHCLGDGHQSLKKILSNVPNQGWLMGANSHGIPRPFVETSVKSCRSCEYGERRLPRPPQGNVRARVFQQYNERHTMPLAEKDHFINKVKATHTVRLSPIQDYNRVRPYLAYVVIYACHRGKFRGTTMLDDDHNDGIRQRSTAKYVGYSFRVKIVEPIEEGLDIRSS
jgi:hypothetical protein